MRPLLSCQSWTKGSVCLLFLSQRKWRPGLSTTSVHVLEWTTPQSVGFVSQKHPTRKDTCPPAGLMQSPLIGGRCRLRAGRSGGGEREMKSRSKGLGWLSHRLGGRRLADLPDTKRRVTARGSPLGPWQTPHISRGQGGTSPVRLVRHRSQEALSAALLKVPCPLHRKNSHETRPRKRGDAAPGEPVLRNLSCRPLRALGKPWAQETIAEGARKTRRSALPPPRRLQLLNVLSSLPKLPCSRRY